MKEERKTKEIILWLREKVPDLEKETKTGLADLRFHDLRHHAITELAKKGEADLTIMSIAGHISRRMLEHYSHIRMETKRRALEALEIPAGGNSAPAPVPPSPNPIPQTYRQRRNDMELRRVTLQSALHFEVSGGLAFRKLLRSMVGPNGLEPLTSTVSR